MNAAQVRAYVAAAYPQAMQSPLALAIRAGTDAAEERAVRTEARAYAESCLVSCDGWDVETLGNNVASNFPELDADECDEIAAAALS